MTKSELLKLRRTELAKTVKLLRMYPEDKKDLKPAEKVRSAVELATTFINEENIAKSFVTTGEFHAENSPWATAPATMEQAIAMFEKIAKETDVALERLSETAFQKETNGFGVPMPLSEILFMLLLDHIHHRGQFTIYSRMAGGKVPQIYGPSADEPWQAPV